MNFIGRMFNKSVRKKEKSFFWSLYTIITPYYFSPANYFAFSVFILNQSWSHKIDDRTFGDTFALVREFPAWKEWPMSIIE